MAGDWRNHARGEIARCQERIEHLIRRSAMLKAVISRTRKRSDEEQFLRELARKTDIERLGLELQVRGWRRVMRLTVTCPRCLGRERAFPRPPCPRCHGQGAVWKRK